MDDLITKGYCIIPNVLNEKELSKARKLFFDWKKKIPSHDLFHSTFESNGIYKYHQVGHQEHAWYIRTRPQIVNIFREIWNCDDLVVSYDGTNYISKYCNEKDVFWTHTDQAPNKKGLWCYQGFVSLTENKERTLVVYEGSHEQHAEYFETRNIQNDIDWFVFDKETIENMKEQKRVLHVPAGALVIWDSRIFHQNQYGKPDSEERLVQYVCYLPRNNILNTKEERIKHLKYFFQNKTTTHWPYPALEVSTHPFEKTICQPRLLKYINEIIEII